MTVNETIASPFVSIGADTGGAALVSPAVFELSSLEYVIYIRVRARSHEARAILRMRSMLAAA